MLKAHERGDTLVEVIVAFAVFALVSVGAIVVMNRGIAMTERSLEVTLVREQIDAQAEILRYARDTQSPAWTDIRNNLAANPGERCPDTPPSRAFIANVDGAGTVVRKSLDTASFQKPATYSKFTLGADPRAYGLWVMPVDASAGSSQKAYDMYIYACWYAPGDSEPTTLGTIVRLYET